MITAQLSTLVYLLHLLVNQGFIPRHSCCSDYEKPCTCPGLTCIQERRAEAYFRPRVFQSPRLVADPFKLIHTASTHSTNLRRSNKTSPGDRAGRRNLAIFSSLDPLPPLLPHPLTTSRYFPRGF